MATEMQFFNVPSTWTHISSHTSASVNELIYEASSIIMSTSNTQISSYLVKNPPQVALQRCVDRIRLVYYRYEVTFGLYAMTPGESLVVNSFVILILLLLFWALLVYLPALFYQKLSHHAGCWRATAARRWVPHWALSVFISTHDPHPSRLNM